MNFKLQCILQNLKIKNINSWLLTVSFWRHVGQTNGAAYLRKKYDVMKPENRIENAEEEQLLSIEF